MEAKSPCGIQGACTQTSSHFPQTPLRSLYLETMQNGGQTDSTARCCKSGNYVGRKGWIVCEMDVKDGLGTFHCVRRIAEHIALLRAREMKIMQNVPKASRPPYTRLENMYEFPYA